MRILLAALLFFSFAACNNNSSDKTVPPIKEDSVKAEVKPQPEQNYIHKFKDSALENKITSILLKLPFVQKSNGYIDSISNHQHVMAFMLDTAVNNEISVQAGYNGEQRFETYYHFYVNKKTMEVKVYDAVADKKLSVKEFIKTLK